MCAINDINNDNNNINKINTVQKNTNNNIPSNIESTINPTNVSYTISIPEQMHQLYYFAPWQPFINLPTLLTSNDNTMLIQLNTMPFFGVTPTITHFKTLNLYRQIDRWKSYCVQQRKSNPAMHTDYVYRNLPTYRKMLKKYNTKQ